MIDFYGGKLETEMDGCNTAFGDGRLISFYNNRVLLKVSDGLQ
jgi:hypothetical protein